MDNTITIQSDTCAHCTGSFLEQSLSKWWWHSPSSWTGQLNNTFSAKISPLTNLLPLQVLQNPHDQSWMIHHGKLQSAALQWEKFDAWGTQTPSIDGLSHFGHSSDRRTWRMEGQVVLPRKVDLTQYTWLAVWCLRISDVSPFTSWRQFMSD